MGMEDLFFSDNREQETHIQRIPQLHQCDVCGTWVVN